MGRRGPRRAAGPRPVDRRRLLRRRPLGRVVHRGRLAAHRRRRDDLARGLHPARRPHQGPRQIGRRVDLLGRARERDHGPPEGQRGGRHRPPRRALGRASAGLRRARAGRRHRRRRGARLPRGARRASGGSPSASSSSRRSRRPRSASSPRRRCASASPRRARPVTRRPRPRRPATDALAAGLVAAVASGVPSTAVTLARGESLLDGARAAGSLLVRDPERGRRRAARRRGPGAPGALARLGGGAGAGRAERVRARRLRARRRGDRGARPRRDRAALRAARPRAPAGPPVGRPRRVRPRRRGRPAACRAERQLRRRGRRVRRVAW